MLVIPTPGGVTPVGAAEALAGPDWIPFTGTANLWCSFGNPSPGGFCTNYHRYPALDIGMGRGTPIHAAGPGVVVESGNGCQERDYACFGGRGNFVAIRHPNGLYSRYLHLSVALVAPNTTVSAGQRIGTSGATGSVCQGSAPCPHLHYDEVDNYATNHHVDPGPMLANAGGTLRLYPNEFGHTSWAQTPYGTALRNDGFALPPAPASRYRPVSPTRVLDSRTGLGGWSWPLEANAPRELQVTGTAGVPASASAVVMNVTATDASGASFLTVYPAGVPTPTTSNLNYGPGTAIPNLVTVRVANGGRVAFANGSGWVSVIADVVGYGGAIAFDTSKPDGTPRKLLDVSRLTTLGWSASTPLSVGLRRAYAAYLASQPRAVAASC